MGFIEIENIVNLIPEQISEDEKENLYTDMVQLQLNADISANHTVKLFRISQEVLKYKGEQVESLISELDNLAAKLGEAEAKHNHSIVEEVDLPSIGGVNTIKMTDTDDYHRKLVKMEIENNQLMGDLQEKEQELINEKKELEKLTNRVSTLEEENRTLRNELQATQQELTSNTSLRLMTDDQEYPSMEKYQELTELLRQKNKHITQLLNDIEDTEKENITLKDQLFVVRDELAEGTDQMSKLSMERLSLTACVDELKTSVGKLEQQNAALRNQISELVADKETQSNQFDNVRANFESKLQQWKEMLHKKDIELTSLRLHFSANHSNHVIDNSYLTQLSNLNKIVLEREEKILELQQQLEQATIDLNESTRLMEEQRASYLNKFDNNAESSVLKQLRKRLEEYGSRIGVLESRAIHAEEESFKKAQEVTELIIQLREYESGTYGLEEAMARIKDLQKQKQVRDSQIEELVHNSNQLQDDVNLLEQENQILRERLGISPSEQIVVEDFSRRNRDRHSKLTELTEELEKSQNELLSYRLENRSLKKRISSLEMDVNFSTLKDSTDSDGDNPISTKDGSVSKYPKNLSVAIQSSFEEAENLAVSGCVQDIIDENESLRRGMHEILDSIRNKDGSSFIQIESETLERLLEALDSRHVSGWYQPAMRLQAHIYHLNGVNQTLREELHLSRQREEELIFELHEANQKVVHNPDRTESTKVITPQTIVQRKIYPKLKKSISCSEDVLRANTEAEKLLEAEKNKSKSLEKEIEQFREKLVALEEQMKSMDDKYDFEKANWLNLKSTMQSEIEEAKQNEQICQLKISEYEKSLEILKTSPEEINRALVDSTFSITSLKVEQMQLLRKNEALLQNNIQVRQEKNSLQNDMLAMKATKDKEIVELRKIKEKLSTELKSQLINLSEYVNRADHDNVLNSFHELTVKHREMLNKQILLQSGKEQLILKFQKQIASLQSQKIELETALKISLEEEKNTNILDSNTSTSEQLATLTKQVAALQLEGLAKKQQADHLNRMYDMTKEQLTEVENRCSHLEDQLRQAVESNSELQKSEANLKDRLMKLPNLAEFEDLVEKLKNTEYEIAALRAQRNELEELANIAQDQAKALEQYNKHQDFEFDSLQRRILELQSLSDEKVIIDRLTKELLLLQRNGVNANNKTNSFEDMLAKSESELLQTTIKLNECEKDYIKLKRDSNIKIRCMHSILYELQKRYLGAFPIIKEELCFENIMRIKDECFTLTSFVLDIKPPSILNFDDDNTESLELMKQGSIKDRSLQFKIQMQDFNMRLMNEGLQNKIHLYAEKLERQDKLINRLEQEITHADEQCQEFLLYWNPHTSLRLSPNSEEIPSTKFTQTIDEDMKCREPLEVVTAAGEPTSELNQANRTVEELYQKLKITEELLRTTKDRETNMMMKLREKEQIITNQEELLNLQKISHLQQTFDDGERGDDQNSIKKLALKTTVDSLQNIVSQKEEIIKRLQTLMKKNGEEHAQSVVQLLSEVKTLQDAVDAKDQAYNRLKSRLDAVERSPSDKQATIDLYITKIHELEDELNQSNVKVEQLSSQLTTSSQQAELWSHTAEERLKTLQNMKHELDTKQTPAVHDTNIMSYSSLLQIVKEKSKEVENRNQTIEEMKKRLGSGEKLPGYRDRLKSELERHKKKIEVLEQREKENKAEIERLRSQVTKRSQSIRKKDTLLTPKEEQLTKKIKMLENQIEKYVENEKKWTENRRIQINEELEKWQNRKRNQYTQEKLQLQVKDLTAHNDSLQISNERLKETIVRLEKERLALDSKLKAAKSQTANASIIEELQKTNARLEEEIKVLYRNTKLSAGSTSLTNVIEAQERKIKALELAEKGDFALAEEVERLDERKSQLQRYNVHLEEENLQLKLEIERMKSCSRNTDISQSETIITSKSNKTDMKQYNEELENQLRGNRRKNCDLEKAVLVLRRVVEKLQAENKRLHNSKVNQLQDKSQVEKLQIEFQNLQENYLEAIEKISTLDKELQNKHKTIEILQKLTDRLQSSEEITNLKNQLNQKNHLLSKVKALLEKAAVREKELLAKVNDLQSSPTTY